MRVLIAVDGSSGSFEAAHQIGPLLKPGQDEVLLYCHPPQVRVRAGYAGNDTLVKAQEAMANAVFAQVRERLPEMIRDQAKTVIGHQEPKRGINIAADQNSTDLIVMGARGLGMLQRLFVGSVSRAVAHTSKIPIWIARKRNSEEPWGPRILIACKCPKLAKRSIDLLSQFTWPKNTTVTMLSVVPTLFAGHVPEWLDLQAHSPDVEEMAQAWARDHDKELRQNLAHLQNYVRGLPVPFDRAQSLVVEGDPASEILDIASSKQIDLVILGAQADKPMISTLLGSTAETLLNHADCSVLIIPAVVGP